MRLGPAHRLSLSLRAGANALGLAGLPTHPPAIIWVLTQRCFYRCLHCDSWRDERPIDGDGLLAIAAKIAAARTKLVALSGGEPFVVKQLPVIVARLKAAGKIVSISTNGHLLEEGAAWLVEEAVDHLQVSVDGPTAALHDRIRGQRGSLEKILRGIAAVRRRRGTGAPRISVCGVVMKENAAQMGELVDRFAGVADDVELQPLHDSPGLLATSASSAFASADRALVEETLERIAARHPSLDDGFYRGFARFLFEPESMRDVAVDHCLPMIFNTLTIREDGAFRICRYPLGANVRERSIDEIWNSPARWALYRALARDGCTAPCWLRCHTGPSAVPGRALRKIVRGLAGRRGLHRGAP